MKRISNCVGLATLLGGIVACGGGTAPGPAYQELDDTQSLPVADTSPDQGGDTTQRASSGDSALGASQQPSNDSQAAPVSGQRPLSDSSQEPSSGTVAASGISPEMSAQIGDVLEQTGLSQLGITEGQFTRAAEQCISKCGGTTTDCQGQCVGLCAMLIVLQCSDMSAADQMAACCAQGGDAEHCGDSLQNIDESILNTCSVDVTALANANVGASDSAASSAAQ